MAPGGRRRQPRFADRRGDNQPVGIGCGVESGRVRQDLRRQGGERQRLRQSGGGLLRAARRLLSVDELEFLFRRRRSSECVDHVIDFGGLAVRPDEKGGAGACAAFCD